MLVFKRSASVPVKFLIGCWRIWEHVGICVQKLPFVGVGLWTHVSRSLPSFVTVEKVDIEGVQHAQVCLQLACTSAVAKAHSSSKMAPGFRARGQYASGTVSEAQVFENL